MVWVLSHNTIFWLAAYIANNSSELIEPLYYFKKVLDCMLLDYIFEQMVYTVFLYSCYIITQCSLFFVSAKKVQKYLLFVCFNIVSRKNKSIINVFYAYKF